MCDIRTGLVTHEEDIRQIILDKYGNLLDKSTFDDHFQEWKYNLCLGEEVYISTDEIPRKLDSGEFIVIRPGDFVLLLTKEKLKMPKDVMGFISMRFTYKQKGLINVSGFHVDPCYEGRLIFSAFNAGPRDIIMREGDPVFMIFFERLNKVCKDNTNISIDTIPINMVENIRGGSATLSSNAHRLDKVEFYLKLLGTLVLALLTALIGIAIK